MPHVFTCHMYVLLQKLVDPIDTDNLTTRSESDYTQSIHVDTTRHHISCCNILGRSATANRSATVCEVLQHPLAYQRLSLRLGTSEVSNDGFCCNLCVPLVVDIHLEQSIDLRPFP